MSTITFFALFLTQFLMSKCCKKNVYLSVVEFSNTSRQCANKKRRKKYEKQHYNLKTEKKE